MMLFGCLKLICITTFLLTSVEAIGIKWRINQSSWCHICLTLGWSKWRVRRVDYCSIGTRLWIFPSLKSFFYFLLHKKMMSTIPKSCMTKCSAPETIKSKVMIICNWRMWKKYLEANPYMRNWWMVVSLFSC